MAVINAFKEDEVCNNKYKNRRKSGNKRVKILTKSKN